MNNLKRNSGICDIPMAHGELSTRILTLVLYMVLLTAMAIPISLAAQSTMSSRSGIEFSLANADLVTQDGSQYLSIDVLLAGQAQNQRLGTGIVLLNYSTSAFGQNINANQNVIVSKGALIYSAPFPFYHLIVNDNQPSRLAVTFEYMFPSGFGSVLTYSPQILLNLKLKVQNNGVHSGLSFQEAMMQNQQYMDDNLTHFTPVIASDSENALLSPAPVNLTLTINGDLLFINWPLINECYYSVYSSTDPGGEWVLESDGLAEPVWNCSLTDGRKFFRVTAEGVSNAK